MTREPTLEAVNRALSVQVQQLMADLSRADATIRKLEAALRDIEGMIPYATPDYSHRVWTIARAALEVK